MERGIKECCGLNFRAVSFGELFFNKTMLFAYLLLAVGIVGWAQVYGLRFGHDFVNTMSAVDAGGHAGELKQVAAALKEQIFGMHHIEEVGREEPWGMFVVQYIYLLYGGSALVFLVALGELFGINLSHKASAALMTFGISMAIGGLISIATDLAQPLNIYWMFLNPQPQSGMWLMLPLYSIYIPFTFVEIYFLMTNKRELAKKLAIWLVLIGLCVDIAEYYIQGLLFQLNTPRSLWVNFPMLWVYFLLTGILTGVGFALIYGGLALRAKDWYGEFKSVMRKVGMVTIVVVALYETITGLSGLTHAPFNIMYYGYVACALIIPFVLFLIKWDVLAGVFITIGTFALRELIVFGGNAEPMANRFGKGVEAYSLYGLDSIKNVIYEAPHLMEVLVIVGALGVGIALYSLLDTLLDVRNQPH
jgi:hypothetical protein